VTNNGTSLLAPFLFNANPPLAQAAFNRVTAGNESRMPGPIPAPPFELITEQPALMMMPVKAEARQAWLSHVRREIDVRMVSPLISKIHIPSPWRMTHENCCPWW
jgi:hypothetical protein